MMLKPGHYKSEHDGDVFHAYRYVMEVKETTKSYIFKLLEVENRYADDHIEIMFGGKKRIVLPKDKPCRHAMRVWSDHDFTGLRKVQFRWNERRGVSGRPCKADMPG